MALDLIPHITILAILANQHRSPLPSLSGTIMTTDCVYAGVDTTTQST